MVKLLVIDAFALSYKKYLHFLFFIRFLFQVRNKLDHWRLKKPNSQAKIKLGTLSSCIYNPENLSGKFCTYCS